MNADGPGTVMYVVANLGGAAPDRDGDLIVGTLTLECSALGDATVDLTAIPGVATWSPIDDASIEPATLTLSPRAQQPRAFPVQPRRPRCRERVPQRARPSSRPPCLVEQMYGEDSVEVAFSRYLRDSVLRKTPEGRELIKIYYDWSPQLVSALEEETALKDQVKKVLDQILILIKHEKD